MGVEAVITPNNKTRYLLLNDAGDPVEPVLKYLKYKDNTGAARNTLRAYCCQMKLFLEYLEQERLNYRDIGLDEMAAFMRWLQNPYGNKNFSLSLWLHHPGRQEALNLILRIIYL